MIANIQAGYTTGRSFVEKIVSGFPLDESSERASGWARRGAARRSLLSLLSVISAAVAGAVVPVVRSERLQGLHGNFVRRASRRP